MKIFNVMDWFTRSRPNLYPKIDIEFQCTACNHRFKRKVRRMYIDLNTYDERHFLGSGPTRSEFVIAERITCPKCKTVDQFKLRPSTYSRLAETPLIANNGLPAPHKPIQCVRFALRDGRSMHPLDALQTLAEAVEDKTDTNETRLEYANLLRMLGYYDQAEAQYQIALERNSLEPEALLNLAIFHGKRREKDQAVEYLLRLVNTVGESRHPDHALFAEAGQQIIDGEIQMDSIELTAPVLFVID
jgi:hypothetical protein